MNCMAHGFDSPLHESQSKSTGFKFKSSLPKIRSIEKQQFFFSPFSYLQTGG